MRRVLWTLLALLLAAPAFADSTADEADFRFHRGATLYRQNKVEDALGEFLASNRLVRNRNVIFNIARSFEQLGRFNEAYRWYTEILADEMPDADRKELQAGLKRLQPSLALLHVDSTPPGATVYVDRKDLGGRGQTPLTLALPPGKALVLVDLAGFRLLQEPATVAVGRTVEVRARLDRIYGAIAISGEPKEFEVRVDDEASAPIPVDAGRARVVPGRHLLLLTSPGYLPQQLAVDIPASGIVPVTFKLLPLPPPAGALVVRANLDGALIRVDGREMGFTPAVIERIVVGSHKVEILADGREPSVQQVEVEKEGRSFVDARLKYALPRVVAAEKELTRAQDAPASITVISGEEIRGFGYTTLSEALRSVRGLYTTYDRSYETLGVRGFSSPGVYNSRVLVLSDGHTVNESSLGQGYVGHDFDADLSDIERIEVVRGPGSVLYGSAAFFAVVNVVHRTPAVGVHGELGGLVGTLGENSGHASFSGASEHAYGWVRASGLDQIGDPLFVSPADGSIARNLDKERAGHLDLRARAGDFSLAASFNNRRKLLPTGAFDTVFGAPGTQVRDQRGFIEGQWNHAFPSGLGIDARVAYDGERYNGSWQYTGRAPGNLGGDTSAEDWGTAELRVRLPEWHGHRFFAGSEVQDRFRINLTSVVPASVDGEAATHFSNFQDGLGLGAPDAVPNSELVLSGYLGDDFRISSGVQLDVAVRVDQYLDNDPRADAPKATPAVNPRAALLLQPYEAGRTKLLFGKAFRNPGFYERFFNDGGVSQVAARNLRPETVYTAEVEHTHQFTDEVSLLVTGFVSEMRDLLRIGSPAPGLSQYENRPFKVHTAGAEAEVRWQAGSGWIFSGWYAYSVVRDDGATDAAGRVTSTGWFQGSPVPNSPEHTGAFRALYPLISGTLSLSTELLYNGPRRSIREPDGSDSLLGEQLFWNLGVSGEYQRFGLRYGAFVENVLDQRTALPAGPEISFPSHAVPQYGRTLRLQLSGSF